MLRIPEDFETQYPRSSMRTSHATIIDYEARERVMSQQVLVTRPTIVLVVSGSKQIEPRAAPEAAARPLTAEQGCLLVIRSGTHVMSEFRSATASDGNMSDGGNYRSRIVSVDRAFLREALGTGDSVDSGPGVVVTKPNDAVVALLHDLPASLTSAAGDADRQFRLRELLVLLARDDDVRELVFRETAGWGASAEGRIATVMASHCLSPLQVPEYADLCAMSLSSFKRHFETTYGASPGRWLTQTRMSNARTLLERGTPSISEACQASGYTDLSSFTRAFRREYRMSPSEVRQQARDRNADKHR